MKGILRGKIAFILFVLFSVSLVACGGGGGGGSSSSSNDNKSDDKGNGLSYAGAVNQATVDNTNANEISTSAYQGGNTGTSIGSVGVVQTDSSQIGHSRSLILSQALKSALLQVDVTSTSGTTNSGAVVNDTGTIPGDCAINPGDATYNQNIDDVTGDFSGTMSFNSYCSEGVRLSGIANYSGKANVNTGDILQLGISFDAITATAGSDSFTVGGSINFNFGVFPMTATINMLLLDNSISKVFKIENFGMSMVAGVNYVDVSIVSGRFYHPDYGYVVVSTSTPLRIFNGNDWPSQGVIVCTGNTGIGGGSTKAKLTVLSSTQFQVEADTNGDGSYVGDYNSGPLNWSNL